MPSKLEGAGRVAAGLESPEMNQESAQPWRCRYGHEAESVSEPLAGRICEECAVEGRHVWMEPPTPPAAVGEDERKP
jgi:hypothetical protein